MENNCKAMFEVALPSSNETFINQVMRKTIKRAPERRRVMRFAAVTAAITVCVMLSGIAYAVVQGIESFNVGGRKFVMVDEDYINNLIRERGSIVEEGRQIFNFDATFEEAAEALGQDFRLPAAHVDGYKAEFMVETSGWIKMLYNGNPAMYFEIYEANSEFFQHETFMANVIATEFEIAGTTVYKMSSMINLAHLDIRYYTWEHDGLVYFLYNFYLDENTKYFPDVVFTEEQCIEIIRSMIE